MVRRQKRSAPKEEPEKVDEEEWSLKDVIFVEDSPNFPMIGKVLKVKKLLVKKFISKVLPLSLYEILLYYYVRLCPCNGWGVGISLRFVRG